MTMTTKSGAAQPDPQPNAGSYNSPSPRISKTRQEPFTAPSSMDSMRPGQPAAHAGFDAMVNGCGAPTKTPSKR